MPLKGVPMIRLCCFSLLFFFPTLLYASQLSSPIISQVEGMVVVYSNTEGFTSANKGMQLKPGDEIRTGKSGKVYIDFPDQSRVKLGRDARFIIENWSINDNLFSSTLRMLQGAFRYTATALKYSLAQRRTTLKTKTAVLGVRGTDFWGRADPNSTFFLLLEGKVEVTPIHGASIPYDSAGYAIHIEAGKISKPEAWSSEAIAPLAAETEIPEK